MPSPDLNAVVARVEESLAKVPRHWEHETFQCSWFHSTRQDCDRPRVFDVRISVADLRLVLTALREAREDGARYRFLRDNRLQLRAIDGNATWCGDKTAEFFDFATDNAMNDPAFDAARAEAPDAAS